jgi:hypothetical protein
MVKSIDWDDVAVMSTVWGCTAGAAVGSRFRNKVRARTLFLAPRGLFSPDREPRRRRLCRAWTGLVTINIKAPRLRDLALIDRLGHSRALRQPPFARALRA